MEPLEKKTVLKPALDPKLRGDTLQQQTEKRRKN